jgi:chaperonin GroES
MTPFPIKPNEDRVIVFPEILPDKTDGGLWIPDTAKGAPKKGTVVAVGDGKACSHCGKPEPLKVEVGMEVTFPETAGISVNIGDKVYIIIRATDIQLFLPKSVPS